jgi:hypothetical protein
MLCVLLKLKTNFYEVVRKRKLERLDFKSINHYGNNVFIFY